MSSCHTARGEEEEEEEDVLTAANQLGCTHLPGLSVTWSKTSVLSVIIMSQQQALGLQEEHVRTHGCGLICQSFVFAVMLCDVERKTGPGSTPEATLVGQARTLFRQE